MKRRILSLLFAFVFCFTFIAGCGGEEPIANSTPTKRTYEGVHVLTAPETNDYIVKNGKTDYRIVLPEVFSTKLKTASEEFQFFFKEATGIQLIIEYETGEGKVHTPDTTYFSFGDTKLFQSTGIEFNPEDYKDDSARIITKDKTIYFLGSNDSGVEFAAYDALQILFNYEYYFVDCWEIDKGVVNLKLRNFDVTDVPDIEFRNQAWGIENNAFSNASDRWRKSSHSIAMAVGDTREGADKKTFHNTNEIIPVGPAEWFSDNGDQLCYTAHGDDELYDALVDKIVDVVSMNITQLSASAYKDVNYYTISHEDNGAICSCKACMKDRDKYGAPVGSALKLLNDVQERLKDWMQQPGNEAYRKDDLMCYFFAYGAFMQAPTAEKNPSTGKWEFLYPEIRMRDDVGSYLAISAMNYIKDIYDPLNDKNRTNVEIWGDTSASILLWTYNVNFANYMIAVDSFSHFNTNGYQFYASLNPCYVFNQAAGGSSGTSNFQALRVYLDSKGFWDSRTDTEVATDNWFNAMYGEAAGPMKKLFMEERLHINLVYDMKGAMDHFGFSQQLVRSEYWPVTVMESFFDLLDEAYEIAERVYKESDPERYEKIVSHINMEKVYPAFCLAYYHAKEAIGPIWVEAASFLKYTASELPYKYTAAEGNSKDLREEFRALTW